MTTDPYFSDFPSMTSAPEPAFSAHAFALAWPRRPKPVVGRIEDEDEHVKEFKKAIISAFPEGVAPPPMQMIPANRRGGRRPASSTPAPRRRAPPKPKAPPLAAPPPPPPAPLEITVYHTPVVRNMAVFGAMCKLWLYEGTTLLVKIGSHMHYAVIRLNGYHPITIHDIGTNKQFYTPVSWIEDLARIDALCGCIEAPNIMHRMRGEDAFMVAFDMINVDGVWALEQLAKLLSYYHQNDALGEQSSEAAWMHGITSTKDEISFHLFSISSNAYTGEEVPDYALRNRVIALENELSTLKRAYMSIGGDEIATRIRAKFSGPIERRPFFMTAEQIISDALNYNC